MKKLISIILSLCLLIAFSSSAFAAKPANENTTTSNIETSVTNEYEAMLLLQQCSPSELSKKGYSESDINTINNADELFDEHIQRLAIMPESRLTAAGYSNSQITSIKSYNPETATSSDKARIAAECKTTSVIDRYTGKTGRVTSSFKWVGIPAFKMRDVLVTAWNNWQITGKTANIKYTHINGTQADIWRSPTYQPPSSGMTSYGSGYRYPAALQDNAYYASEGYSIFVLSRQSSSHLETISRVIHQQGVIDITYTISSGFDIGISVGRTVLGDGHDETP